MTYDVLALKLKRDQEQLVAIGNNRRAFFIAGDDIHRWRGIKKLPIMLFGILH